MKKGSEAEESNHPLAHNNYTPKNQKNLDHFDLGLNFMCLLFMQMFFPYPRVITLCVTPIDIRMYSNRLFNLLPWISSAPCFKYTFSILNHFDFYRF